MSVLSVFCIPTSLFLYYIHFSGNLIHLTDVISLFLVCQCGTGHVQCFFYFFFYYFIITTQLNIWKYLWTFLFGDDNVIQGGSGLQPEFVNSLPASSASCQTPPSSVQTCSGWVLVSCWVWGPAPSMNMIGNRQ